MDDNDVEAARESLLLRMKCFQCSKTFEDPRTLPCGHSFCFQCIENIHSTSTSLRSFSRHRTSTCSTRRSGGYILCPTCTTLVALPVQGASGLPQAQSVDDVRKSAIDELSKLLQVKYRRRTTGNIGEMRNIDNRCSRVTQSGNNLLLEENEEDTRDVGNRHSYPNARLGHPVEPAIDTLLDYESAQSDQTTPLKLHREELFERNRRSRRSNRNLKSNLRPTSEYSDVSRKNPLSEFIEAKPEENLENKQNVQESCDFEMPPTRRPGLLGSRSFSVLDQNKSFVSTTRRCFSLRDKIRREPIHRYSDTFDSTNHDARHMFSASSFPSSSRSSFERRQNSSSFDSSNGACPSSFSDFGTSTPRKIPQSSRYKSAPENFCNYSFKSQNGLLIIDEAPKFENLSSQKTFAANSNSNNRRSTDQSDKTEKETKKVNFSEEEMKERLSKYRETPENSGSAKLVRISEELFCLPSAISGLPNKCLAVADHGSSCVLLFDGSWTTSMRISGIKPFGLAYSDASGILYVSDRRSKTLLLYDAVSGDKRTMWPADMFSWICSVAVVNDSSHSEQLAVLDRSTSSVKICDPETGAFVRQFGSYGNDVDQFCMAEFFAWDSRLDCLFVSDSGNHRIVAFDPRQATPCFTFGQRGVGDDGCFQWPKGVCVDQKSNVYVADSGNKRISRFTADGCFIEHVVCPINAPYTLAVESNFDAQRKPKNGTFLNLTTFSLQNKAQLFRYSI